MPAPQLTSTVIASAANVPFATETEKSENDMNEQRNRGDYRWALLLIPAALIVAKGARHRRAMWGAGAGPAGAYGFGHRHPGRFRGDERTADERGAYRLPPRIESMLDSWHTHAHQAAESTETTTI